MSNNKCYFCGEKRDVFCFTCDLPLCYEHANLKLANNGQMEWFCDECEEYADGR